MAYERKLPTTDYWIFLCNLDIWNADHWLALGEKSLCYRISDHHQRDMRAGQLGVLRIGDDRRSAGTRKGFPKLEKGIYAVFRVTGPAVHCLDSDRRCTNRPEKNERRWRVPVEIVADFSSAPVLASSLPRTEEYKHIHKALHTTTIALSERAFRKIASRLGLSELKEQVPVDTAEEIHGAEMALADATPEVRERVSKTIERGRMGQKVKADRGGRCQLCEALGRPAVAFINRKGMPFAEAHHVIPVSELRSGSLSHLNIMALCPNHHREVHFGRFYVVEDARARWVVSLNGRKLTVDKPKVGATSARAPGAPS